MHSEWGDVASQTDRFGNWRRLQIHPRIQRTQGQYSADEAFESATIDQVTGEYCFMMAYTYFALARRYGGVPPITEVQEFNGDYDAVKVPRSTEVATEIHPRNVRQGGREACRTQPRRSGPTNGRLMRSRRAALYAASVGKFWDRNGAMLTGEAVTETRGRLHRCRREVFLRVYQGFGRGDSQRQILAVRRKSGVAGRGRAEHTRFFVEARYFEVIFLRDYVYPGIAHNMGKWHEPNQLAVEYGGRCCRRSIWSSRMPLSIRRPAWEHDVSWSRPTTETELCYERLQPERRLQTVR